MTQLYLWGQALPSPASQQKITRVQQIALSIWNLQSLSKLGHQPMEHVQHLDYKGRCLLKSLSLSTENCLIIHPFIPEINTSLLSRNAFPEIQLLHVFSLALCMDITTSQKRTGDLLNYMILRCSCRSCIWCGDCEKTEAKSHVKKCALIPIELDWRANRLSPMNRLSSEITGWSSRLQENNWPLI